MTGLRTRERPPAGLEPISPAWGGLVASIGLMVGTGRDLPLRLTFVALAFLIGGFLAGVRASARRPAHALAAVAVAYLLHAGFVVAARAIDAIGGPGPPALVGDGRGWALAAVVALAAAASGGALVGSWLRPAGQGNPYRPARERSQPSARRSNSR